MTQRGTPVNPLRQTSAGHGQYLVWICAGGWICRWLLAIGVVLLPIVAVLNGWVGSSRWTLTRLQIIGQLHHVSSADVRLAVLPYAQAGFFAVALDQAQQAVLALPWVKSAQVSKHWPNRLDVLLEEYRPFARWGQSRLLSENGQLFSVPNKTQDVSLPLFVSADSNVSSLVDIYNQACQLFAPVHLTITQLEKNERGDWSLILSNGMLIVIGRDAVVSRLRRFALALPRLFFMHAEGIKTADLRYPDGFALRFNTDLPAQNNGFSPREKEAFSQSTTPSLPCDLCSLFFFETGVA